MPYLKLFSHKQKIIFFTDRSDLNNSFLNSACKTEQIAYYCFFLCLFECISCVCMDICRYVCIYVCIKKRVPLYQVFVDLTKVFDAVNRSALWL